MYGQGDPAFATSLGGLATPSGAPAGYTAGFHGGVPVVMCGAGSRDVVVVSPLTQFLSTTFFNSAADGVLYTGVEGRVSAIPAGHTSSVIVQYGGKGVGLTESVMGWGDSLLATHGKERTPADINVHVERLGYSGVGHYFYGLHAGKTAEQTFQMVKDEADQRAIPYSWYLLDSWWYGESATPTPTTVNGSTDSIPGYGGTWRWDDLISRSHGFPSGLRNLTDYLGAPLVMHMGQLIGSKAPHDHPVGPGPPPPPPVGAPPYATDPSYPGQKGWVVEDRGSLPLGPDGGEAFWDFLFKNAADWGLLTFKLDHTQTQVPDMNVTQNKVGTVDTWLTTMTNTAAKHGVYKQFGGCVPAMMLHSVTLQSATTARVGDDYIPSRSRPKDVCRGVSTIKTVYEAAEPKGFGSGTGSAAGSASIAQNSLVWWAVGVRPYKDATFTANQTWGDTTCMQGPGNDAPYTMPEWWGLQDPKPALGVVVSAMAAGPIAGCDGIGDVDRTLLMRTARDDGVLLKPGRPALALDSVWYSKLFPHGPEYERRQVGGEISATYTEIGNLRGLRWYDVLGWGSAGSVTLADLVSSTGSNRGGGVGSLVAWAESGATAGTAPAVDLINLRPFTAADAPLAISGDPLAAFTLWHVAPTLCNGLVLLGELSKFIVVSPQRIAGKPQSFPFA